MHECSRTDFLNPEIVFELPQLTYGLVLVAKGRYLRALRQARPTARVRHDGHASVGQRSVQVKTGAEQGGGNEIGNGGSSKTNRSLAHYYCASYRRKNQDHCVLVCQADAKGKGAKYAIE
jgi:hypothetical protein